MNSTYRAMIKCVVYCTVQCWERNSTNRAMINCVLTCTVQCWERKSTYREMTVCAELYCNMIQLVFYCTVT